MNLWIRSTSKTNLLQARFLTIMEGKTFYKKNEWEYEGYTICNVALNGNYELLGTYKTKERALEVLDEIQNILSPKYILDTSSIKPVGNFYEENGEYSLLHTFDKCNAKELLDILNEVE